MRLRFNIEDDLSLLRLIIAINPYEEGGRWKSILEKFRVSTGKEFSCRAVKEHAEHLLKLFIRNDRANLRKYVFYPFHYSDVASIAKDCLF